MKRTALKNLVSATTVALAIILVLSAVFAFVQYQVKSFDSSAQVAIAADYYSTLDTSSNGATFRSKLAELIEKTHTTFTSYSGLRDAYKTSDADPNKSGNIIWFYSGTSVSFNGSFGSSGGTTNREHVWPKNGKDGKAFDGDAEKNIGSDAHHLRPAEQSLNASRGDKQFGEVSQIAANIVKQNSSTSYDNLCYASGDFFYPGEGYRGATARILMYVETRWGDKYNLKFVLGGGDNKTIGDIETLMKWHYLEPPTEEEIRRNDAVFKIQGNRNPFIDHPEYATQIYCYDGKDYNSRLQAVAKKYDTYTTGGADITSISLSPANTVLSIGGETTLTATIAPANAKRDLTWTSSNPSVATVDTTGKVTALANGTTTITCASTKDGTIKSSATITVKSVTAIDVSGTLAKTVYNEGEIFNPAGLKVSATYSDGTKGYLDNSSCQWLDSVTRNTTLSIGTTSVICKVGTLEKTVNGITVKEASGGAITIDRSSFTGSGKYAWCAWSAGGVDGKGFMYPNNKDSIQMNSDKTGLYIFNTTPIPGNMTSITIKMKSGQKDWQILTSPTPFAEASGKATGGTDQGTKQATENGTIWSINTTDRYFAINYADTNAAYIDSIVITYGGSAAECDHTYGDWAVSKEPTETEVGEKIRSCTKCGHVEMQEIPMLAPCDHVYGEWTVTRPATEDEFGEKSHSCTKCGHVETEEIPKLTPTECDHTFGEWTITKNPTTSEKGEKTRSCTKCGYIDTEEIEKLPTVDDFKEAVAAIDNATTPEEKQEAIERAELIFDNLTDGDKSNAEVMEAYNKLSEIKSQLQKGDSIDGKLSSGAIAGIAVGSVAGAGVIVLIIVLIIKRKKAIF